MKHFIVEHNAATNQYKISVIGGDFIAAATARERVPRFNLLAMTDDPEEAIEVLTNYLNLEASK